MTEKELRRLAEEIAAWGNRCREAGAVRRSEGPICNPRSDSGDNYHRNRDAKRDRDRRGKRSRKSLA
jgi:hypothetical protein